MCVCDVHVLCSVLSMPAYVLCYVCLCLFYVCLSCVVCLCSVMCVGACVVYVYVVCVCVIFCVVRVSVLCCVCLCGVVCGVMRSKIKNKTRTIRVWNAQNQHREKLFNNEHLKRFKIVFLNEHCTFWTKFVLNSVMILPRTADVWKGTSITLPSNDLVRKRLNKCSYLPSCTKNYKISIMKVRSKTILGKYLTKMRNSWSQKKTAVKFRTADVMEKYSSTLIHLYCNKAVF